MKKRAFALLLVLSILFLSSCQDEKKRYREFEGLTFTVYNEKYLYAIYKVEVEIDGLIKTQVFAAKEGMDLAHPTLGLKLESSVITADEPPPTGDQFQGMKEAFSAIDRFPKTDRGINISGRGWGFEFKINNETFTYFYPGLDGEYERLEEFIEILMPSVPVVGPLWIYSKWLEGGTSALNEYDHDIYRPYIH